MYTALYRSQTQHRLDEETNFLLFIQKIDTSEEEEEVALRKKPRAKKRALYHYTISTYGIDPNKQVLYQTSQRSTGNFFAASE